MRRAIKGVAQVVNIGQGDIDNETAIHRQVIVGIFKGTELLFYLIEVRDRIKGKKNQVKLSLVLKLKFAHVTCMQHDALLYRFRLAFQFAPVGIEHFRSISSPSN